MTLLRNLAIPAILLAALCGCETMDAVTGGATAEAPDTNTEGMSCAQMSERYAQISATQRRLSAAARLTGQDTYGMDSQYAAALSKVHDAQIAAGCS